MADLTGKSIGRYHIVEKLGEGGMAVVYKAYDTRLDRNVAIKVIRTEIFGPAVLEPLLKRFEREAKALAHMQHPNIVHIIDYGELENVPYLVMEYLPGGTLKGLTGKPVPFTQAARLVAPVARALEYAHQEGIIHRDVKPANVLMTRGGAPMLTDFGIAKILETDQTTQLTGTGMSIGTPEYMAPEQWTGDITPKVDIYALGIIFYELITGHRPYTADTPAAILIKVTNDPLPRPRNFILDLPDAVERVLYKALAKQPEDRYADMGVFAAELEKLSAGVLPAYEEARQQVATATIAAPTNVQPRQTTRVMTTQIPARPTSQPAPAMKPTMDPAISLAQAQKTSSQPLTASPAINPRELEKPKRSPWLWAVPTVILLLVVCAAGVWAFYQWTVDQTARKLQATRDAQSQFNLALTVAVQTAKAQVAANNQLPTPEATSTQPALIPTFTQPPQTEALKTDAAEFMADVTVPDNTVMIAGTRFTKTWRVKNTGTTTWTTEYGLVFYEGDKLGGPDLVRLTDSVSPGDSIDISVDMAAPGSPGFYKGFWLIVNEQGDYLNIRLFVSLRVPEPTALPAPTATAVIKPSFTAGQDMFCREGPSTSYDSPWQLNKGDTWPVIGKWYQDSSWILVDINSSQTRTDCCWVAGSGKLNVSLDSLKNVSTVPDRMDCSSVK